GRGARTGACAGRRTVHSSLGGAAAGGCPDSPGGGASKLRCVMRASTYPLVDAAEAAALVLDRTPVLPAEDVVLADCPGRVLAEDLIAPAQLPPFPASAVDGYAIRSEDGGGRLRVVGESAAGRPLAGELPQGAAARILTGGVLPQGADTVVMVEDVEQAGSWVLVPVGFPAGRNFHRPGDDLRQGELVIA